MKKEIFALTLSAVMAAGTCSIPVMAADDTYNVGICQLVQHEALDAVQAPRPATAATIYFSLST